MEFIIDSNILMLNKHNMVLKITDHEMKFIKDNFEDTNLLSVVVGNKFKKELKTLEYNQKIRVSVVFDEELSVFKLSDINIYK